MDSFSARNWACEINPPSPIIISRLLQILIKARKHLLKRIVVVLENNPKFHQ